MKTNEEKFAMPDIDKNPLIDAKMINDYKRIHQHLVDYGVVEEKGYSLTPPLGRNVVTLPSTNAR